MKVFAFVLATLFTLQAFTPALCMTNCAMEATSHDDCCMVSAETCGMMETTSQTDFKEIAAKQDEQLPCNACNIPCCSAPLCCFYYQDVTELDFSVAAVLVAGPLPSNNGIPDEGFRGDCFQPPEVIS